MFDGLKSALPSSKTDTAATSSHAVGDASRVESPPHSSASTSRQALSHRELRPRAEMPMMVAAAFVGTASVLMAVAPPPLLSRPSIGAATAEPVLLAKMPRDSRDSMLPVSQTFVVTLRPAAGQVLRGRVRIAERTVTGQAPMSGQVARVLVRPGRRVDVGDRVLELSTGTTSRAPRGAERQQSAAEREQVAAVARQQALEAKMNGARVRFVAAQQRVAAANTRLDEARDLLDKLRAGKTVAAPKSAAPKSNASGNSSRAARSTSRRMAQTRDAVEKKHRDALQQAVKAQREADDLASRARNAFYAAAAADNVSQQKKSRVDVVQEQLRKVEARFAAEDAKADELEAARGALSDAQSEATEAATKATAARRAADDLQAQRDAAKEAARGAANRAAQSLQKLQPFASSPAPSDREPKTGAQSTLSAETAVENGAQSNDASGNLSLSDAARMVSAAVAESEAAARQARRLKDDVDTYQRQVQSTQARLESSSQDLAKAQQSVLDSTIRAGLSEVRAPAAGVVLSVASVAQEVSPGDALITIGRPGRLEVVLSDTSGAWRGLKEGSILAAVIDEGTSAQSVGTPLSIRIDEINAPSRRSGSAELHGVIVDRRAAELRPGTRVACTVAAPGSRRALMVPSNAIVDSDNGQSMVAVLQPVGETALTTATDSNDNSSGFRLEWRPVTLSNAGGPQREVARGLRPGERIVLGADAWRAWSSIHGSDSVIRMATA